MLLSIRAAFNTWRHVAEICRFTYASIQKLINAATYRAYSTWVDAVGSILNGKVRMNKAFFLWMNRKFGAAMLTWKETAVKGARAEEIVRKCVQKALHRSVRRP